MLAQAGGQILYTLGTTWKELVADAEKSTEPNKVRSKANELTRKVLSRRMSMSGNFHVLNQDLLNQHAETVAVAYHDSLHNRRKELLKDIVDKKAFPFLTQTGSCP